MLFWGGGGGLPWPPCAAAAVVLLPLAECVKAGRQNGWARLSTAIWRTLADKKIWRRVNFLLQRWQFLRQSGIECFQVLKNFSHTIINTCKNMHKCMNSKTLAHIAKNYCFCPFTCIPTRLFQWLDEGMNIHFPFPAAPLQLFNQILSN